MFAKKALFLLATVLMGTVAMAQSSVKVAAHFNKGDYVIYESEATSIATTMGTPTTLRQIGEVKYEVTDVRPDGYTIDISTLKWDNAEGDIESQIGEIGDIMTKLLVGKKVTYLTDSSGKIIKIENYEDLKREMTTAFNGLIDKIFENAGNDAPLDKDMLKTSLLNEMTEDKFIESINSTSANQFSLYGKTLATGTMEDEVFNGIKLKTTYVVTPSKDGSYTIKSSSVGNMSEDDMVNMIIEQVEKMMPDQVEMIKQNIGTLKQTGLLKLDASKQCTYDFMKNGWLKNGEKTFKINMMGNDTESNVKWKIKETNIK